MLNPTIKAKTEPKFTLSRGAKRLFQAIYREQHEEEKTDDIPKIKVSEMISKMAFYYEKIRNSVDYKEDYLLRKNAIERILKRQIFIESAVRSAVKAEDVAKHLLVELIRAGYLANNKIYESKIEEIAGVIEKYLKLKSASLKRISSDFKPDAEKKDGQELKAEKDLIGWLIAIAASDIESRLAENKVNRVIVADMYGILDKNVILPADSFYEKDREIQIYLGIYRNFLKFDSDMLSFIVFRYYNAGWDEADEENIRETGENIFYIKKAIDSQLHHPLAMQLDRIVGRYNVFFSILTDVIKENPETVYEELGEDQEAFARRIKKVCAKRYKKAKAKLWRAAVRSIIYIFITKSVFAILLEIPAAGWFGEEVNTVSLIINISFPAALLFLIVFFMRLPSDANTDKIADGIKEIAFAEKERSEPFRLRQPAKRGRAASIVFGIIYAITFFLSFGLVIWALNLIAFNFVSTTIFLFFLAFVSFFSVRIRKAPRELIIIEPRENIFSFIADFFYIPIVAAGKWLSERFSKINVFVFILDFIIEAPFKIFVEAAEEWTKYVKERKDEIG